MQLYKNKTKNRNNAVQNQKKKTNNRTHSYRVFISLPSMSERIHSQIDSTVKNTHPLE